MIILSQFGCSPLCLLDTVLMDLVLLIILLMQLVRYCFDRVYLLSYHLALVHFSLNRDLDSII